MERSSYLYQQIGLTAGYIQTLKLIQLTTVENNITQILPKIPRYPTTAQITEAFRDANNILVTCFVVDSRGEIFHVENIDQLTHGQPIWRKTDVMLFPNFYYSDQAIVKQFPNTGFHIDKIEDHYTEEKGLLTTYQFLLFH